MESFSCNYLQFGRPTVGNVYSLSDCTIPAKKILSFMVVLKIVSSDFILNNTQYLSFSISILPALSYNPILNAFTKSLLGLTLRTNQITTNSRQTYRFFKFDDSVFIQQVLSQFDIILFETKSKVLKTQQRMEVSEGSTITSTKDHIRTILHSAALLDAIVHFGFQDARFSISFILTFG